MSISTVTDSSYHSTSVELADTPAVNAAEEKNENANDIAAATVTPAPSGKPTIVQTSASTSLLAALEDEIPLGKSTNISLATVSPEEQNIIDNGDQIVFTSRAQAELILGISLPEDVITNTFRVIKESDGSTSWLPITLKRAGTNSITNPSQNQLIASPAGSIITRPAGQAVPFSADDFLSNKMHSSEQIAIMLLYGQTTTNPPSTYLELPGVSAVLNEERSKVIIIKDLDNRSIASLSLAEQRAINLRPAFESIKLTEGLSTTLPVSIQNAISAINGYSAQNAFTNSDKKVFLDQIEIISESLKGTIFYNVKTIDKEVSDILSRFRNAYAYGSISHEGSETSISGYTEFPRVVSLDGGETIKKGYTAFMEHERRLLEQANSRINAIQRSDSDPRINLPELILRLMLSYNLSTGEKASIISQDIEQQSALLKTYGEMQRLISQTSSNHPDGDAKKKRILGGKREDKQGHQDFINSNGVTAFKVANMFNMSTPSSSRTKHPIEEIRGITRPLLDLFNARSGGSDMLSHDPSVWPSYSTQLADTVTLLNQETQTKMNDLNAIEKEKNRYFDMANNAIAKLNEMVQSIARSIG